MRLISRVSLLLGAIAVIGLGLLATRPSVEVRDLPLQPWPTGAVPERIVAFGTSLTAGNAWPDRLTMALTECFGRSVEVARIAAPGAGSLWGVSAVPQVIALAPDLVLIEFAINDADLRDGVRRSVSRTQHIAVIDALAVALPDARVVLLTMSPAYGPRGWMRPRLARYYADVAALAAERDLGLIDLYPRWQTDGARADLPDGLHPTNEATERIVDPVLLQAMADATGQPCGGGT